MKPSLSASQDPQARRDHKETLYERVKIRHSALLSAQIQDSQHCEEESVGGKCFRKSLTWDKALEVFSKCYFP